MKPLELIEQGRFLGEEFILWLWMRGLAEGGTSGAEGDQSACFLDDSVQLVSDRGDVKELSLRKGNPAESMEAFEALSRGMRVATAKARLLSGDLEWCFTLRADTLDLNALKLPPSQAKDPQGRASDRLFLLEEGVAHLERRMKIFFLARVSDPQKMQKNFGDWISQGLEGAVPPAPWEEES